jgi:hypothetical protein
VQPVPGDHGPHGHQAGHVRGCGLEVGGVVATSPPDRIVDQFVMASTKGNKITR